jgi:GNAT superfamily N-acetyltransferase
MSDVAIATASEDDVRRMLRRRASDETTASITLERVRQGTVWIALDQTEPVGIAVAGTSDEERFVGDLFVEPSYRGQGIGGRLLDAAFADTDCARSLLLNSDDASALALVLRRRIVPRETIVRVAGAIPREDRLAAMAAGDYRFEVEAIDPIVRAYALSGLDRTTRGTTRSSDHEFLGRVRAGLGFLLADEFVAYAYAWPDGRIGPLASASSSYVVQIVAFMLVTLRRNFGASWCTMLIPARNERLARAALDAGLRIEESLTLAGDTTETLDLACYAGFHRLLF